MLVIISGCSGVGKNTIINEILHRYSEFALLPTYTTREKRVNETEGCPYFFASVEEFKRKIDEGEFYEHQIVHNHYYGVSRKVLMEKKQLSKILIKDVDVLGTQALTDQIGDTIRVLTFFYYVESKSVLVERLKGRKEKNIDVRLERYEMEMQLSDNYDYLINNCDMETTLHLTKSIIDFEINNKRLQPAPSIGEMDERTRDAIAEEMKKGVVFPAIDVALVDGELYITDGNERYMAAMLSGKRIAKRVTLPELDNPEKT